MVSPEKERRQKGDKFHRSSSNILLNSTLRHTTTNQLIVNQRLKVNRDSIHVDHKIPYTLFLTMSYIHTCTHTLNTYAHSMVQHKYTHKYTCLPMILTNK